MNDGSQLLNGWFGVRIEQPTLYLAEDVPDSLRLLCELDGEIRFELGDELRHHVSADRL